MICQNCSSPNPEGQSFCGNCGHRLTAETIGSLADRVSRIEGQVRDASHATVDGRVLELDTAANVMDRVKKWTTLILFFSGIPVTAALLFLAIVWGKSALDLRSIAASAKTSVESVLQEARGEATEAKKTADSALSTSKEVDASIKSTQESVSKLKADVDARSAEVGKLATQLYSSEQKLAELNEKLKEQDAQSNRIAKQVQIAEGSKAVLDVQAVYPVFGQHIAHGPNGYIEPKAKPADAIYVDLNLSLTAHPNVSDTNVGAALSALRDHKYTAMVGPVYLEARTAAGSAQNVGMPIDAGSTCYQWAKPQLAPPCIVYFRPSLKNSASEIRTLVKVAQDVPEDHVVYVDPTKLNSDQQELLNLSAVDIAVDLGQ